MVMTLLPHYETTDVRIEKIVVGPFENNVFVLRSKSNGDAVIIDAANEHELLLEVSRRTGVRRVLTTHGHFDHIQAVTQMRDAGIDVGIAAEDAKMLPSYDFVIPDDDVIEVGDLRLRTIHTPGHTPGSTCFLLEGHPIVFSGDTLFPGGPGNTTFEDASFDTIIESIDRRLFTLPADTLVLPGPRPRHDDRERVAASRRVDRARLVAQPHERASNPALSVARRRRRVLRDASARPTRRSSCSATARAATTGSGSSRCRCSRATTASITWDQRGFGLSTNRHGHANPRTATADLLAILDHLGVERAHVVGQSMGGWAAMGLAVAHARSRAEPRARRHARRHPDRRMVEDRGRPRSAKGRSTIPRSRTSSASGNPERAHLYLQIGGLRRDPHADPTPVLRTHGRRRRSPTSSSPRCAIPTLFIVGTDDEIFPPASIADSRGAGPGRPGRADRRRRALAVFRAARRVERPGRGTSGGNAA